MTKRLISGSLLLGCCLLLLACNTASPKKYFDLAVLSSNSFWGFANDGLLSQLESPSVKLSESTGQPVPMLRKEVIRQNIEFAEEAYDKLKGLKITEETKEIMQSSLALYELVLPVYKKEYMELATLYDKQAPKEQIEAMAKTIQEKYYSRFDELYTQLITQGKTYAEKNGIKVQFVQNTPS